jgi:hypothetical protein
MAQNWPPMILVLLSNEIKHLMLLSQAFLKK